jgi:iron complex outermembrane receptor protein
MITPLVGAPIVRPQGIGNNRFSNLSPSAVIGYNITPDVNIYAKYSKGYKTGGYNLRASSVQRFNEGFGPETLDSFEGGIKSTWLDNRLRLNLTAFRSNYKDIQTNVHTDPTNMAITDIIKAGKARKQGVELEIMAKPTKALTFSINYAYLDAGFQKIVDPATGADITGAYTFIEAPKHTLSASLEYVFPQTPIGIVTANIDYFQQSRKSTATADARYILGDYGLLNARLTLSDIPVGFGKWRLSAFGRNITNEDYYIAHFNAGLPGAIFGEPRTYGLEMTFEY